MSEVIKFDADDLTLGEVCDIEDVAGEDAVGRFAQGDVSPKALAALVWIIRRRSEPEFTFADAKALRVADILFEVPSAEGS